ncbi:MULTISPECIES: hypothetical protein [unclassified Microbacterium]|uniref:hypothetical protein n=1 Tax=unclassified Microbacterium TaxID=2609290 RepID=UPI00301A4FA1
MDTVTIEQLTIQKLSARAAEDAVTIASLSANYDILAQTVNELSAQLAAARAELRSIAEAEAEAHG